MKEVPGAFDMVAEQPYGGGKQRLVAALATGARPTCERIRDRLPNLVAVDFYRRGDVVGVVDALNRVAC
jgi:hypothetical protein